MALACINPHNGHVMAMVGGCNEPWEKYQFNCATEAKRQPGSSFKAFVYATALAQGWSPYKYVAGTIPRVKLPNGRPWVVRNHGGANGGSMVSVFAQSVNTAAVHTIWQVGPENVIATAKEMGIQSALQPNYSLALGTSEVTVQEMASAYGVFATMGKHAKPVYILEVRDANGNIIHQAKPDVRDVKLPQHVFTGMERLTRAVVQGGTGSAAGRVAGAHGKTGTSESYRDAWFVGYTPELTCAVWAGNRDNSAMRRSYGGGICAPVWADFMSNGTKIFRTAKNKFAPKDKQQPQLQNANFKAIEAGRYWEVGPERLSPDAGGMMRVRVCADSGERGRGACPKVELREYKSGSEPKTWCSEHGRRRRVASGDTEEERPRRRRYSRRRRSDSGDAGTRSPGGGPDVPAPDTTPAVSPE
jgi:membrane peptidoglycan carboxypeptidase